MPIVEITAGVPADLSRLLAAVKRAGARALDCPEENLWVMFRAVPAAHYSEDNVLVTIRANVGRTIAVKRALSDAVAAAVAGELGVPETRVWTHLVEMNPDDIRYGQPR